MALVQSSISTNFVHCGAPGSCASVAQHSADEHAAEKRSQAARVRFSDDTKAHDGLCHASAFFNEYMKDVFRTVIRPNGDTTVSIVARRLDMQALVLLKTMLVDLIQRCECSPIGRAAVLNHGGSSAGSVLTAHIPYLHTHVEYLETVVGKVRGVIERRAQQAQQETQQQAQQQPPPSAQPEQQQRWL